MSCFTNCTHSEYVDDVLSVAKKVLTTSEDALEAFPVPGLAPATKILVSVIERIEFILLTPPLYTLQETRATRRGLQELSVEISKLVNLLDHTRVTVQRRIDGCKEERQKELVNGLSNSQELFQETNTFIADLTKLKNRANELYKGPFFLRCLHSSHDADVLKELRMNVTKIIEYFKLRCLATMTKTIDDVLSKLDELERKVEEVKEVVVVAVEKVEIQRNDDILERLPHADASYRASANAAKSGFLEGTRSELFKLLDAWAEGQESEVAGKSVCILTGGAGTGKSTIASEFARRLHDCGSLGASFFFVRGIEDIASTRLFFPTIAYQLAHSQDALYPHIVDAARHHLKMGKSQQMRYEAQNLLQAPLSIADGNGSPVFLVVDALDECTDQARTQVPEMLQLLLSSTARSRVPVRIFFTSRPEHVVETTFAAQSHGKVHTISLHDLPRTSIDHDIELFIQDRFRRIPNAEELLREQPHIVPRLAKRSDGLFVYSQTAMDFLAGDPDFLEERVQMLLTDSARGIILGPLFDLYLTVLENAFPPKDMAEQPAFHARVQAVLGFVALLRDHLSVSDLAELTGIPIKDSSPILYRLRSVVLFNRRNAKEKFRPMHATFPQFLLDTKRCTNKLYYVDSRRENARLAEGCLRSLVALPPRSSQGEPASATAPATSIPQDTPIPLHVQYACVHWAEHVLQSDHSDILLSLLKGFANTRMLAWVEILARMGRLDVVDAALEVAINWWEVPGKIPRLFEEARSWVQEHYDAVAICPALAHECKIPQDGPYTPPKTTPNVPRRPSVAD